MVVGATALIGAGLALPTGLMFGYGYGYGVRAGYSAFKKPSDEVQKLKLSPDPVTGALGAGLQSAEERTKIPVLGSVSRQTTDTPSLSAEQRKLETQQGDWRHNKIGLYRDVSKMTREQYQAFIRAEYPYNRLSYKGAGGRTSYISTRKY